MNRFDEASSEHRRGQPKRYRESGGRDFELCTGNRLVLDLRATKIAEEAVLYGADPLEGVFNATPSVPAVTGKAGGIIEDRAQPGVGRKISRELRITEGKRGGLLFSKTNEGRVENVGVGSRLGQYFATARENEQRAQRIGVTSAGLEHRW